MEEQLLQVLRGTLAEAERAQSEALLEQVSSDSVDVATSCCAVSLSLLSQSVLSPWGPQHAAASPSQHSNVPVNCWLRFSTTTQAQHHEGYASALLVIACREGEDETVCLAAAIACKNAVKRRWNKSAADLEHKGRRPIPPTDKQQIMLQLHSCVVRCGLTAPTSCACVGSTVLQPGCSQLPAASNTCTAASACLCAQTCLRRCRGDLRSRAPHLIKHQRHNCRAPRMVQTQLLEVTREIADTDFPDPWSNLLPEALATIQSGDTARMAGSLLMLRRVASVLEFSSDKQQVLLVRAPRGVVCQSASARALALEPDDSRRIMHIISYMSGCVCVG
jgi:Importin-beta N-terminal domain